MEITNRQYPLIHSNMKHPGDRFSVSVGPHPSGEGEIFQLRRADKDDPLLTADSFTLEKYEIGALLDFCIDHPDLQKWIIGSLSSRGLVPPNIL